MRDSLIDMGQADAGQGCYVHLYLNGIYWGLYDLHERPRPITAAIKTASTPSTAAGPQMAHSPPGTR